MPKRLFEQMDNWAGGVNTSANSDALTLGVSPRGRNSALASIAPDPPRALASKRLGASPALAPVLTDEPTIIGQYFFKKASGTNYHVLIAGDGSLWLRGTDGTPTLFAAAATFTAGDELLPDMAVANDHLFITTGDKEKKFSGTALTKFGIAKRAATPTAVATGAGGVMAAGTYDVLVTDYNSATGHESPRSESAEVTIAAGEKIDVDWVDGTIVDTQITHTRVYVRQQSRGPNFYRVIAGATPAPDATHGGYAPATLSTTLDITEAQFDAFILLAPVVNANVPPPTGAKSPTWHRSRMFVHDGQNLYWSEVEKPEAFNIVNDYEPINPDDGEEIVALHSAHDRLLIIKTKGTYALNGVDPNSWEIDIINPNVGAVNQQCVQTHNGLTFWWDKRKGPVSYAPGQGVEPIGIPLIGPTVNPELLNSEKTHLITSVTDDAPDRQRIMWAIPELAQTRGTLILPYNTLLGVWESDGWNPFDVASMAVAEDAVGTPWVFIGGYSGRLFQWWDATNDGVPEDELTGAAVLSATSTTITRVITVAEDLSDDAWTTNALEELYAYAISSDGLDVQRRRIVSNTDDTITVSPAWGTTPNDTYTFVVGGIDFQWDTPWILGDAPFRKKRYEFLFAQVSSPNSGVPVSIDVFFTYDLLNVAKAKTLNLLGAVVYDSAIYDQDRYASAVLDDQFFRMSKTGKAWRARIRNINPDEELTVLKIAMQSVLLSHKS